MEKVEVEKQFSLKVKDFLKGVYIAVIVPLLVTVLETIETGSFKLDLKTLAVIAVSSLAAYLLKNFFQSTKVVITDTKDDTERKILVATGKKGGGVHPPTNPIHPGK